MFFKDFQYRTWSSIHVSYFISSHQMAPGEEVNELTLRGAVGPLDG